MACHVCLSLVPFFSFVKSGVRRKSWNVNCVRSEFHIDISVQDKLLDTGGNRPADSILQHTYCVPSSGILLVFKSLFRTLWAFCKDPTVFFTQRNCKNTSLYISYLTENSQCHFLSLASLRLLPYCHLLFFILTPTYDLKDKS